MLDLITMTCIFNDSMTGEQLTNMAYIADNTRIIPESIRVETVSTNTADRRLRLRSSYVILAALQYASPVMAAKFMVNLFKKSTADSRALAQHRKIRLTIPDASSCLALSTIERMTRTIPRSNPERHIVPKEGPNAFLQF